LLAELPFFAGKPRGFAGSFPQIIKLCAPNLASRNHLDFFDARRVKWKNTLDTDTVGDFAHRKNRSATAPRHGDYDPFKNLSAFLFTLDDFYVNPDSFSWTQCRRVLLGLLCFQLSDDVHG